MDGRNRTPMLDDVVNAALSPRSLATVLIGIAAAATVFTLVQPLIERAAAEPSRFVPRGNLLR